MPQLQPKVNGGYISTLSDLNERFQKDRSMPRELVVKMASKIREAKTGEAGFCEICGKPIPEKVVFEKPMADRCGGYECAQTVVS